MPFGMMLAARLARGAFSGLERTSSFEGIFSSPKKGRSFDVVRSTLVSDQPADPLDVSKSGFKAAKGLPGQDTILSKGDSASLFSGKSPSDHSLPGETGTVTTKPADGPKRVIDDTDNNDSKINDKIKSKESGNSNWKRIMKLVSSYYDPTNFDGRTLAMKGIDNGLSVQSNSIDAATTRVIRGDSSITMSDFTDRPHNQQNNIMNDMLIMHLFTKSQQKAHETTDTEGFDEEFTKRINEEAVKLKEHAGSTSNTIRQPESSRDSGKQDLTRGRGTNR
jgi:hypothetical protein